MKRTTFLNAALYLTISFTFFSCIASLTKSQRNEYPCETYSPKEKWDESAQFCGSSEKHLLQSLDQCSSTKIFKPLFGYTWFYCYPDETRDDIYHRIELRSCVGFDVKSKTLERGSKYNDFCEKPTINDSNKSNLNFVTNCKYKYKKYSRKFVSIKFDVNDFMKFKEGRLICRE